MPVHNHEKQALVAHREHVRRKSREGSRNRELLENQNPTKRSEKIVNITTPNTERQEPASNYVKFEPKVRDGSYDAMIQKSRASHSRSQSRRRSRAESSHHESSDGLMEMEELQGVLPLQEVDKIVQKAQKLLQEPPVDSRTSPRKKITPLRRRPSSKASVSKSSHMDIKNINEKSGSPCSRSNLSNICKREEKRVKMKRPKKK